MAYGARPLRREITKSVEDALSEEILRGTIQKGDEIAIGMDGENLSFTKTGERALKQEEERVAAFELEDMETSDQAE